MQPSPNPSWKCSQCTQEEWATSKFFVIMYPFSMDDCPFFKSNCIVVIANCHESIDDYSLWVNKRFCSVIWSHKKCLYIMTHLTLPVGLLVFFIYFSSQYMIHI